MRLSRVPSLDTVSLESEPPGAEAKASNGQTCRTPCALALPVDAASSVTFTLNGYLPETERLEAIRPPGEPPRLRPNPVVVELTAGRSPPASQKAAAKKPASQEAGHAAQTGGRGCTCPRSNDRSAGAGPIVTLADKSAACAAVGINAFDLTMPPARLVTGSSWTLWPIAASIPIWNGRGPWARLASVDDGIGEQHLDN